MSENAPTWCSPFACFAVLSFCLVEFEMHVQNRRKRNLKNTKIWEDAARIVRCHGCWERDSCCFILLCFVFCFISTYAPCAKHCVRLFRYIIQIDSHSYLENEVYWSQFTDEELSNWIQHSKQMESLDSNTDGSDSWNNKLALELAECARREFQRACSRLGHALQRAQTRWTLTRTFHIKLLLNVNTDHCSDR